MSRKKSSFTLPDLTEKVAVVTGASDGIGKEVATRLAKAGAEVILPVRNREKGEKVVASIQAETPAAKVSLRDLDLSSLASVSALADTLLSEGRSLDFLINNAAIMAPHTRHASPDGFELQLATNYLGHFALTGRLMPLLREAGARVTTVSSMAARSASYNWDDLQWENEYDPMKSYGQSKLATIQFAFELQRRSISEEWGITSNAAHPGLTMTNLQASGPNMGREKESSMDRWFKRMGRLGVLVQGVETGALPVLYAATSPESQGGRFYGPDGLFHTKGGPAEQKPYRPATNEQDAKRIWQISEELTGVRFN